MEKKQNFLIWIASMRLIAFIAENDSITVKELSQELNLSVTAINNAIKQLKEAGLISRAGARKNGRWILHQ